MDGRHISIYIPSHLGSSTTVQLIWLRATSAGKDKCASFTLAMAQRSIAMIAIYILYLECLFSLLNTYAYAHIIYLPIISVTCSAVHTIAGSKALAFST